MTDSNLELVKEENIVECRACLQEINSDSTYYNLFDCVGQEEQMSSTIAEKLSNIAHVEISEADELPKFICGICYTLLQSAHSFTLTVRQSDDFLRQKFAQKDSAKVWPKPIQISNNIDKYIRNTEIKEEVLSEDECSAKQNSSYEHNISKVEIKVEPDAQDFASDVPKINGVCSLNNMQIEPTRNQDVEPQENTTIKEEPKSDEEMETIESLDCMLCTKTFNSVSGLKAHVITQHSYKGVKRKSDCTVSPKKVKHTHVCEICRRAFATSTDLMVHETCHDNCKCYLCFKSFPTFHDLSQHRLVCCETQTPNSQETSNLGTLKVKEASLTTINKDVLKTRSTVTKKLRTSTGAKKRRKHTNSPHPIRLRLEAPLGIDTEKLNSIQYSNPNILKKAIKPKTTKASKSSDTGMSETEKNITEPNNTKSQLEIRQRDTTMKQEDKKSKKRRSLEINIRISH